MDEACLADDTWLAAPGGVAEGARTHGGRHRRQARPFVCRTLAFDEQAVAKHWLKDPEATRERLTRRGGDARRAAAWTEAALEEALRALAEELGVGAGKLIHPLRVALTGQATSPGIFEVLVAAGHGSCALGGSPPRCPLGSAG